MTRARVACAVAALLMACSENTADRPAESPAAQPARPSPAALSEQDRALAREIGFPEDVLREASRYTVEPITRLNGLGNDFESVPAKGVAIAVPAADAIAVVAALRSSLAAKGFVPFRFESNYGHEPDRIAILETADPFDALRTMKTNGANYDLDTDQVVSRLLEWHRKYGLSIYGAGMDFFEATFVAQPPDMQAFAKEVYEFCPDVVEQGTGTVEALADEMKRSNTLYLWWD